MDRYHLCLWWIDYLSATSNPAIVLPNLAQRLTLALARVALFLRVRTKYAKSSQMLSVFSD